MDDETLPGRRRPSGSRRLALALVVGALVTGSTGAVIATRGPGGPAVRADRPGPSTEDGDRRAPEDPEAIGPLLHGRVRTSTDAGGPGDQKETAGAEPPTEAEALRLVRGVLPQAEHDEPAEGEAGVPSAAELPVMAARARIGAPARWMSDGPIYTVAFTPGARSAVSGGETSGGETSILVVRDVTTGQVVGQLVGHGGGGVSDVSVSPDGRWALSGGYDKTGRLWDLATRQCVRVLGPLEGTVYDADFDSTGRRGVLAGSLGQVLLWDLGTGEVLDRFQIEGTSNGVSLSPDGGRLAAVSSEGLLRAWDVPTGKVLFEVKAHQASADDVAHIPGSDRLVTCGEDGMLRVWDGSNGALVREWKAHAERIPELAPSPDGRTVASGGWEGRVKHWRLDDGALLWDQAGHTDLVVAMAFTRDGRTVASGARDGLTQLWDAVTGEPRRLEPDTLEGHTGPVNDLVFAGDRLVSAGQDATIRLWDLEAKAWTRLLRTEGFPPSSIAIDASGRELIAASEGRVWLNDLATAREVWHLDLGPEDTGRTAVARTGRTVLWTVSAQGLSIHDASRGAPLARLVGHFDALAASPTQALTALLRPPHVIDLASTDGALLRTLSVVEVSLRAGPLAWFPDGESLLVPWTGGAARVRAEDGRVLARYHAAAAVNDAAVTPDGGSVLLASDDAAVFLCDAASGEPRGRFVGHTRAARCVAVAPDGRTAASGGADGAIFLWGLTD